MVGVDEHPYSNDALQWLLDEFVDDGDEVVCVRVVEKDVRSVGAKDYQDEANAMIAKIQEKSGTSRAISIVLEYAVGKLHSTFQRLIQMYQPSMLIVGTRGRSLGGMQGLLNTRNSFSKYCLQYSPIPVVVVRPDEKRQKKKDKRSQDPDKQSYIKMLAINRGLHEADSDNSSLYDIETKLSADEEAHKVAAAIGLPASFDPTLKPIKEKSPQGPRQSVASALQALDTPDDELGRVVATPTAVAPDSGDESGDDDEDDEAEFDVASGSQILQSQKKERLHEMEVGEAAALLKSNPVIEETSSSDEDDEDGGGEIGKQSSSST
ncbi:putative usp domain-containing protein [Phaeoacremonium minimum UCRPA7]|uniref:Putative usp domain-containing protein n=1 Tax=Phaeoacremonium minimum (strain UCR-PA7) TaxID=1286976 RepID=R8BQD7_PHAM7|nr:putative usp domain-containing protein [Phaeoacremonium minimum UCRPA7]EOO01593.1 putative usp domain-containing protein [Phaeoacremonium minimum UCRPA7]